MIRHPLSKLLLVSRFQRLKKYSDNNLHFSMTKNVKNVEPVHMAYTAYEAISPQGQNEIPILILHGILGSKANWNSVSRQLSLRTLRKVIALDARNHGDSPHTKEFSYDLMVEDIKHFMDEMEIEKTALIGHSLGGRAMMAFALKYPDLVQELVVVDISPLSISPSVRELPKVLNAMKHVKLAHHTAIHKARDKADLQLRPTIKNKHLRNFLLTNLSFDGKTKMFYWKVNVQALIDNLQGFHDFKYDGVFDKPTLFIAGALSDYMKKEEEPSILKKFPRAKFVYVENTGHLVHAERPDVFLNIVTNFLEGHNRLAAMSEK